MADITINHVGSARVASAGDQVARLTRVLADCDAATLDVASGDEARFGIVGRARHDTGQGGKRQHRLRAIKRLDLADLWRDRSRKSSAVKAMAAQHIEALERKIEELQSMRKALAELVRRCRGDSRPDCPILDDLEEGK